MKIAYVRQEDGGVSIVNPCPWWRLVSSVVIDGERKVFDPPILFESLFHHAVSQADIDAVQPEWAETEREHAERVWAKAGPKGAVPVYLEDDAVPARDEFRNAWAVNGKAIAVDMPKARDLTRERLREEREPLLLAKDVETMKALESGDQAKLAEVTAEKQRLRDVTALPAIEEAQSLDDLRAISVQKPGLNAVKAR